MSTLKTPECWNAGMGISEVDEMNGKINTTIVIKSRKSPKVFWKWKWGTCLVRRPGFKQGTSANIQLRQHLCQSFFRVRKQTLKPLDLAWLSGLERLHKHKKRARSHMGWFLFQHSNRLTLPARPSITEFNWQKGNWSSRSTPVHKKRGNQVFLTCSTATNSKKKTPTIPILKAPPGLHQCGYNGDVAGAGAGRV